MKSQLLSSYIEDQYNKCCVTRSDIYQHLPILYGYALKSKSIIEFGVRNWVSTWSFLHAKPSIFIGVDILPDIFKENLDILMDKQQDFQMEFSFLVGDTLNMSIPEVDMLFIDTLHTYSQLSMELKRHSGCIRKYILMHDTESYRVIDEGVYHHASEAIKKTTSEKHGLKLAIDEFLKQNKEWTIDVVYTNNNGLTIIKRNSQ